MATDGQCCLVAVIDDCWWSLMVSKGLCWSVIVGRARNNGRSTDNVRTELGVDRSTFRLAGHVDRSHLIVLKMK